MTNNSDQDVHEIGGSCHCGNVRFTLIWPARERTIQVRACGCSFCRKHRGVWTSHPQAELVVNYADASRVEHYRFGTETADFHICLTCGVVPVATSTIANTCYGVVNTNCLDELDDVALVEAPTDFDNEATDARLGRRTRNWIANVTIETGS